MRTIPLAEIATIASGSTPSTSVSAYWGGDIPWVTPADFGDHVGIYFRGQPKRITKEGFDHCSAPLLPRGSILFSSRAPIGHCAVLEYPACTNQGFKSIVPSERLDSVYGFFTIKFLTPSIVARGRGATFAEVNKEIMEDLEVPYCDRPEQRRIGQLLKRADQLCRMRSCALNMCNELLPEAFLDMFGDPATNPHSYPTVPGEELFDADRDGAKCGPFGSALKTSEYVASGVPVWTMANVQANHFTEDSCLYISEKKFEQLKAYSIIDGDILISRAGTVGRMAIVRTQHERSIMHSNLIRLALNRNLVAPEYFVTLMTWFGSRVAKLKTGQEDAYTFMNTGTLAELPIPLPPPDTQKRFISFVRQHEQLRATHVEALRQADHLFKTLLNRAFAPTQ